MNEEVSLAMGEYREIITKAVVAKGRKFTQSNHTISPAHIRQVFLAVGSLTISMRRKRLVKK